MTKIRVIITVEYPFDPQAYTPDAIPSDVQTPEEAADLDLKFVTDEGIDALLEWAKGEGLKVELKREAEIVD